MSKKPAALIILDGFGLRGETVGNAVAQAKKPNFDRYWNEFPHQTLTASVRQWASQKVKWGTLKLGI